MSTVRLPENELDRLAALRDAAILDTPAEAAFDELTELAAYICQTPISTVTFIDADRQWFKARLGLTDQETSRDISFCSHAILANVPLIVPDATRDDRFSAFSNVTGDPHIRFYAGMPLRSRDGFAIGTLCVIDREPRVLTPVQERALSALARQASAQLELRRMLKEIGELLGRVKILSGLLPMCASCRRMRNENDYWEKVEGYIATHSEAIVTNGMCPECMARALADPRR